MGAYETAGQSDDWFTPRYVFDALGEQFDLDVAAPVEGPRHVPAARFLSANGERAPWRGFVWMNPPFGHQATKRRWLLKFFAHQNGLALLPDRTSAPWFQEAIRRADATLLVSPKIKFERPDGSVGGSPGTGSAIFAAGLRGVAALYRAEERGLGVVVTRLMI